jgi:hypothetical protein
MGATIYPTVPVAQPEAEPWPIDEHTIRVDEMFARQLDNESSAGVLGQLASLNQDASSSWRDPAELESTTALYEHAREVMTERFIANGYLTRMAMRLKAIYYDNGVGVVGREIPTHACILRHAGVGKRPVKSLVDQRLGFSDRIFPTPGCRQSPRLRRRPVRGPAVPPIPIPLARGSH